MWFASYVFLNDHTHFGFLQVLLLLSFPFLFPYQEWRHFGKNKNPKHILFIYIFDYFYLDIVLFGDMSLSLCWRGAILTWIICCVQLNKQNNEWKKMPFIHRLEFLRTRLLCSLILAFHTISNMINDSCELAFKRFISE